jgi:hypothetical protein
MAHAVILVRQAASLPSSARRPAAPVVDQQPERTTWWQRDSPHISPAAAGSVPYNSLPPTSGPHYPFTVATGIHTEPVAEGLTVHAMEHGHVVVQYAPAPRDTVERLERLAKRYGKDVLLAPYPPLPHGDALTARGRIEVLDELDEDRVVRFVEQLRGRYQHDWTREDDYAAG